MNSLIWRGVPSTTIKGLLICELPPITKPQMRVSETVIDGRDGSSFEDLGYSSYDKAVQIGLRGEYDIDKVIEYFTGEGDIIFSNEPTKVYSAKICSQIDYNRLLRYRQATVVFRVQPFKHKYNEAFKETQSVTASGTSIVVSDSEEANLKAFKIYGKSTQDGTPTPDAPIDIVSIGDDGNIGVSVNGENLLPFPYHTESITTNGGTLTSLADGGVKLSGTPTDYCGLTLYSGKILHKGKITVTLLGNYTNVTLGIGIYDADKNFLYNLTQKTQIIDLSLYPSATKLEITVKRTVNNTEMDGVVYPIVVMGSTIPAHYECYIPKQSVAFSTPLRAIPVTDKNLATYTDASGKMWCADEIDLERGVYIQRVKKKTITTETYISKHSYSNDNYFVALIGDTTKSGSTDCLSTHFVSITNGEILRNTACVYCMNQVTSPIHFSVPTTIANDVDSFREWAISNSLAVYFTMETPIETPLTDEQIAICKTLKANNPTTTILNDENAYIMVEYIKPFEVMNEGLEPSKPIMTLNGSGTVEISVNGMDVFTYTFPDGENEVVIDSEKQDAYLGDVLKNRNMNGEFPILQPKTNRIEWSGDIKSIKVVPRSRWL